MTRTLATCITVVMGSLVLATLRPERRARNLRARLKPYTVDGNPEQVAAWLEEIAGPRWPR
jgi:hypothetical protein